MKIESSVLKQIIRNTPAPVLVKPDPDKGSAAGHFLGKLRRLYRSIKEVFVGVSGRMPNRIHCISMDFQPKPAKIQVLRKPLRSSDAEMKRAA